MNQCSYSAVVVVVVATASIVVAHLNSTPQLHSVQCCNSATTAEHKELSCIPNIVMTMASFTLAKIRLSQHFYNTTLASVQ